MHDIGMSLQGRDETGKPRVARVARGPSDDGRQGEMEDGWWWWCGGQEAVSSSSSSSRAAR
jgi:hypothetical protein